jgi:hypothetical protein
MLVLEMEGISDVRVEIDPDGMILLSSFMKISSASVI